MDKAPRARRLRAAGPKTPILSRLDSGFDLVRLMCEIESCIAQCADHGTHEQFHLELMTNLDLARLPSGKFDTNYLVCQLAAWAMIILRLMGQRGLLGPDAPVRHSAKRRRIKTVMQ